MTHGSVLECSVVGVPNECQEEDVVVFVVLRPGADLDGQGLVDCADVTSPATWCRTRSTCTRDRCRSRPRTRWRSSVSSPSSCADRELGEKPVRSWSPVAGDLPADVDHSICRSVRQFVVRWGREPPAPTDSRPSELPVTGADNEPLLKGLRILDLSTMIAGPYGSMLLADMGADVVKVEPPHGDSLRLSPPKRNDVSLLWSAVNRNKRCIIIDLQNAHRAATCCCAWFRHSMSCTATSAPM